MQNTFANALSDSISKHMPLSATRRETLAWLALLTMRKRRGGPTSRIFGQSARLCTRFAKATEANRWLTPCLKPGLKAGLIDGSR
jgi:hypothetical protein